MTECVEFMPKDPLKITLSLLIAETKIEKNPLPANSIKGARVVKKLTTRIKDIHICTFVHNVLQMERPISILLRTASASQKTNQALPKGSAYCC